MTPGPFLFLAAQIVEGRSNWVTSEIVYCYRLVCAHATHAHSGIPIFKRLRTHVV